MLIAIERGVASVGAFAESDDIAISAITIAELELGHLLRAPAEPTAHDRAVAALIHGSTVVAYDETIARVHAGLLAHARRTGRSRGPHDLIIAATAAAAGRTVVTADARGFGDLPGVAVRVITPAPE